MSGVGVFSARYSALSHLKCPGININTGNKLPADFPSGTLHYLIT